MSLPVKHTEVKSERHRQLNTEAVPDPWERADRLTDIIVPVLCVRADRQSPTELAQGSGERSIISSWVIELLMESTHGNPEH